MHKTNEVMIDVPSLGSPLPNNFSYIAKTVLRESEVNKEIAQTNANRMLGAIPNYVIKDNHLVFLSISTVDPNLLAPLGELFAVGLTKILDQLKRYNEHAVHSIVSILEPYRETDQDLKPRMPSIVTRDVIVNITKIEKIKPKASLD